jgi:hypothetical protein
MQAPVAKSLTVTTGGRTATFATERTAILSNPNDLMSAERELIGGSG